MGNCCKKKRNYKAKEEIINFFDFKEKNEINNSSNNKKQNEEKITSEDKNYTKILIIKKNKGKKNFKEEEKNQNQNNCVKINIQNDTDRDDDIDSKTRIKKNVEYNMGKTSIHYRKKDKTYKNIILNYLLLHEKLNTQSNLKVYIINKKDNDKVINLYNEIINNNEYQLDAEYKVKEKILDDVIYKSNIIEFNKKIKFYSYEDCLQLKDELIDIVDSAFCKDLGIKENKNLKAIYINENPNSSNKIIEFDKKNKIKVEKRNEQYFLREALEEKDNIVKTNLDFINISLNSEIKSNNIKKNNLIDIADFNNRASVKSGGNNDEDFNSIIFELLILFTIQNKSISMSKVNEDELKNDNNYYYLINGNLIMNFIKEINDKCGENIINLINNFIQKQNYQKFEEFFSQIYIIVSEFKKENNNLFERKYNFKKIEQKELTPNIREKINSLNNNKILYPSDFILISNILYKLIMKIINYEGKDLCDNPSDNLEKYSLLIKGKHIYLRNINKEENLIYICDKIKNENISEFQDIKINVSYILIFNNKEICSNEYKILVSNDINDYILKKELKNNNDPQAIINNNKEEVGIFINLQEVNDLIQENNDNDEINNDNNENNIQDLISEGRQDSFIPTEENEKKIIGLRNIQLNCYANSLLQCLYHITPLTEYFISNNLFNLGEKSNKNAINQDSILNISPNSLSYKYYEVIYHLYYQMDGQEKINSYYPINFLKYIQETEPSIFKPNKVSSPKILLYIMLHNLKKELNKKENIKKLDNIISSINVTLQDNPSLLYQRYLNNFMYENNSIIDQYFVGIQCKIISCKNCNQIDYDFNHPFYIISFSLSKMEKKIEPNSKINLHDCFEHYYNKEKSIKHSDKYLCNNCNNGRDYYKQIYLSPKILIIALDEVDKKGNLFDISLELNINNYLFEKNKGYELIGCINFFREKGRNEQYISYCKNNEDGNWYCFYDECVYKTEPKIDMESKDRWPYILFYKAKE